MEVFSMLRYWRGGGTKGGGNNCDVSGGATTISANPLPPTDDEGPFFDLELPVPDEGCEEGTVNCSENGVREKGEEEEEEAEEGRESSTDTKSIEITVDGHGDGELVINGQLVPVDQPESDEKSNEKPTESPVSTLKPATKFRVFLLGLKKHASASPAAAATDTSEELAGEGKGKTEHRQSGRFFTVKFKVEEVPLMSLFTRDGSRSGSKGKEEGSTFFGENSDKEAPEGATEKDARQAKVAVQRYLKAIKPLYDRVSRKTQGERLSFSGEPSASTQPKEGDSPSEPDATVGFPATKKGAIPAGLRVVYKHLGKGRPTMTAASPATTPLVLKAQRRDDSLMQQEDGIQSAIAYCKQSLNAPAGEVPYEDLRRSHGGTVELVYLG